MGDDFKSQDKPARRFEKVRAWLEAYPGRDEPGTIISLASSSDPDQRLAALLLMREQILRGAPPGAYFESAHALIAGVDNDCRWQALIVVGESIETDPESVWRVVVEFGESDDEDLRDGVATILLEHLLEYHPKRILARLRERIEGSSPRLADTLSRCWSFGEAETHRGEIESLMRRGNT